MWVEIRIQAIQIGIKFMLVKKKKIQHTYIQFSQWYLYKLQCKQYDSQFI